MGTIEKILPILQAQQVDPTQALTGVEVIATKEPLKVVVTGPDDKPMEVKLYLVKVNDRYFLTNFQDDDGIFIRQDGSKKPTFEEILQKISEKYLASDVKIQLEAGGEVGIGNLGNVIVRVGYVAEAGKEPVEDQIVVLAGKKDEAFSKAKSLDARVIVLKKPEQAEAPKKGPGLEPHFVPNAGHKVISGDTRANPGQWVTNQPNITKVEDIPTQASDADITSIVKAAAYAHKDQLLPYIGDYNNDGVIDEKDLDAMLADPNADKDNDGIPDVMEQYDPWFRQLTDPSRNDKGIFSNGIDSDGDGVDNLTEMLEGKNPNDPSDNSVVSDVRTTTQKVTFTGAQVRHDGLSGLTTKADMTAEAEYTVNPDGTVSPTKTPKITYDESPDTQRFWQFQWGGDAYVRYSLHGDGKLTLGHKLGYHSWERGFLSDGLDFDPMKPWRFDATLASLQWQINPDNLGLLELGGTYGNPISNVWVKLGAAHNLGKGWELEEAFKLYPWRMTDPTVTDHITGTTHVDETTTRVFETQGGVHQSTYTGSQDFPGIDLTNQGSIPHGNDLNFDLSLRLKKTWQLDDGAYLQAVLNPVVSQYNMFGAEWPFHLITGFGGYNWGFDAVKFDAGAFGRYSAYDKFSRHAGMINPFFNIHIKPANLSILGQYWGNFQGTEDGVLQNHGGSATVRWDALPWMSPYVKYQGDQHYQMIPELYPGFGGSPANHQVLGGLEFRIPTKSEDHKVTADVYGGYGSEGKGFGGGKVQYDGRSGTTTFGATVGADYTHSNIADVSPADKEDATRLMSYGGDKVTARSISKEAKATIIDRLKILAYIKDRIFTTSEMELVDDAGEYGNDAEFNVFKAYVQGLDESYFEDLKLNEEGFDGEILKQVQAFNALSAADKKAKVLMLFNMKHLGLLEVNDNADNIDDVQPDDVLSTWMAALVMGKIAEKEQAEITKTAALSMGYNPEKLETSEKAALAKELAKIYYDEEAENIDHYMDNTKTNIALVEKAAREFLVSQVGKADEAIDAAEALLKTIILPEDWPAEGIRADVDWFALILKFIHQKVKDLPTLQTLIGKLKEIEAKLEPFNTHPVISKILVKITAARKTAEKLEAVWVKSIEINALMDQINAAIRADVTTDTREMYTKLNKLIFGEWTSTKLEGGLIQHLGAYLTAIGKGVDTVRLPGDTADRPIVDFHKTITPKDVFDKMWGTTMEDSGRKKTRAIMADPATSLFLTVISLDDSKLYSRISDKYSDSGDTKLTELGLSISDYTNQMLDAAALYYALIKSGNIVLPQEVNTLLENYLRYDMLRQEFSQDPISTNPADVNFFALVYMGEKANLPVPNEKLSTVKYLASNIAEMPYIGWDKQVRLLIEKTAGDKAAFKKGLKKLIPALKAKAKSWTIFRGQQQDKRVLDWITDTLMEQTK